MSHIIYNASKGSKYFDREEARDKELSSKIDHILSKKAQLERLDLSRDFRLVDTLIAKFEASRDLSQYIVHVDCDAFFAAVELLSRPELIDVPFAVGGGVLSTCNYAARKFGCRSGMAGFVAKKLCPNLVILKPDMAKYSAKAKEVRSVLARYDPCFESASVDEAYLNVTDYCTANNMDPGEAVAQLRKEVMAETQVTISAGIAANTRLAKICSNINKPNGQYVLANERSAILDFMKDLVCRKVNGIGRVFERELASVGIKTCGDIYEQRQFLSQLFGEKACYFLIQCYLGVGRTSVLPTEEYTRKSVGTESTFSSISDPDRLKQKLQSTANELEKDLQRAECKGRTLVLKLKLDTFEVYTRQAVLVRPMHLADDLYKHAVPILEKLGQEMPGMKVRLLGLRCTHLVSTKKPDAAAFFGIRPLHSIEQQPEQQPEPGLRDDTTKGETCEGAFELNREDVVDTGRDTSLQIEESRSAQQETWWHCPVCFRPQQPDERQFNCHVDTCLSRRTILEAVHEQANDFNSKGSSPEKRNSRQATERKRGRPVTAADDPKQKKICFNGL